MGSHPPWLSLYYLSSIPWCILYLNFFLYLSIPMVIYRPCAITPGQLGSSCPGSHAWIGSNCYDEVRRRETDRIKQLDIRGRRVKKAQVSNTRQSGKKGPRNKLWQVIGFHTTYEANNRGWWGRWGGGYLTSFIKAICKHSWTRYFQYDYIKSRCEGIYFMPFYSAGQFLAPEKKVMSC